MMQNKMKGDAEFGMEMEGWTDVKKTGPKLVEE